MRITEFYTWTNSDVYHSFRYDNWKYGDDDEYNRDKLSVIPWYAPVLSERQKTKACANLQTRNIR